MTKNLTIRKRIVLWFAVVLLIIVLISEAVTFIFADRILNKNAEERLVSQVKQNSDEIEFYDEIDGSEQEEGDEYVPYEDGWLEIDDDFEPYMDGISTALIDSDGDLLYGKSPVDFPPERNFTFTETNSLRIGGEKYYIFEMPLEYPEGLWLRGYISNSENSNIMYHFVRITLWLIPLLAVFALIGGYLITRRSLRPIAEISSSAEAIGHSGDLSERLDIGEGNDEIHQLADTINSMFDKLEKNFEAEKQFTSDVSHELRTPTAVIMAQSEYALELAESRDDYIESLQIIHRQSRRMNDIINQLLFFSRLELGTQSINIRSANISELTDQIAAEQKLLATNGITIETDIEPDVNRDIDVPLFTRMINNLIDNAYKYGKPGGSILVSLKKISEQDRSSISHRGDCPFTHVLSIRDDGIGISEKDLNNIWNRFFQVDTSRTEGSGSGTGIGLGLSMVKQISAILGFDISVESTEGSGTVFRIFL